MATACAETVGSRARGDAKRGVSRLLAACDRLNRCHMYQAAGAIDMSPDDAIRLAALVMTAVTTDPASEGDVAAVERAVEAFLGRVGVASGEVN